MCLSTGCGPGRVSGWVESHPLGCGWVGGCLQMFLSHNLKISHIDNEVNVWTSEILLCKRKTNWNLIDSGVSAT